MLKSTAFVLVTAVDKLVVKALGSVVKTFGVGVLLNAEAMSVLESMAFVLIFVAITVEIGTELVILVVDVLSSVVGTSGIVIDAAVLPAIELVAFVAGELEDAVVVPVLKNVVAKRVPNVIFVVVALAAFEVVLADVVVGFSDDIVVASAGPGVLLVTILVGDVIIFVFIVDTVAVWWRLVETVLIVFVEIVGAVINAVGGAVISVVGGVVVGALGGIVVGVVGGTVVDVVGGVVVGVVASVVVASVAVGAVVGILVGAVVIFVVGKLGCVVVATLNVLLADAMLVDRTLDVIPVMTALADAEKLVADVVSCFVDAIFVILVGAYVLLVFVLVTCEVKTDVVVRRSEVRLVEIELIPFVEPVGAVV